MEFAALALLHGRTPHRPDRRTLRVEEDGLTPSSARTGPNDLLIRSTTKLIEQGA
jgi:hypothetical protein